MIRPDRFRIMTYDYHWSGSDPGPIAPLWWMEAEQESGVDRRLQEEPEREEERPARLSTSRLVDAGLELLPCFLLLTCEDHLRIDIL